MPKFAFSAFAVAGLACAAGPVLIHLLNRRRFRVVQWAAMDFLREALQRNRRILQLRDLLLLLLRCAAIALFGLALAQPYLAIQEEKFDASQPLHAVLVLDNSMSMAYEMLDGTLLDKAKQRAAQFIEELPRGSRISVVPLCGSSAAVSSDPYRTRDDALDALRRIEVVDRSGSVDLAANKARRASEAEPSLAKRIVFFSDQQQINWRDKYSAEDLKQLPPMQLVEVSTRDPENTWIAGVEVQDGVADVETPATLVVRLGHEGAAAREPLPVMLWVDGVNVNTKTVSLEPGTRAREVSFQFTFDTVQPEPGQPVFVPVKVSIPPDRLTVDDEYHLMVPVVAALPVVFIDQLSAAEEDPVKGQIGETFMLRRLLAPVNRRQDASRQLVRIRHIRIAGMLGDELRDILQDARLVVMAGIESPAQDVVDVLRQYVEQGGQLLIAAGGPFDPVMWNLAAWRDGDGILPAPLQPETFGKTPDEAGLQLKWFALDNTNQALLSHDYFLLADNSPDQLAALYAEPLFFKAVAADVSDQAQEQLVDSETDRLRADFDFLEQADRRRGRLADLGAENQLDDADRAAARADEEQLRQIRPQWLTFSRQVPDLYDAQLSDVPAERERQLRELAARTRFRVLARFDNALPYLVERSIGRGRVLLATSGVRPEWNTLSKTYAIAVFDRMLRSMIESTLPQHNFPPVEAIAYPVGDDRDVHYAVYRPGEEQAAEAVDAGFIGAQQRAVTIPNALHRGVYRLAAFPSQTGAGEDAQQAKWQERFAVNGAAAESELKPLDRGEFENRQFGDQLRWVGPGETISLAGPQVRGQDWWKYLIAIVLALLLLELVLLAWPAYRSRREELATAA